MEPALRGVRKRWLGGLVVAAAILMTVPALPGCTADTPLNPSFSLSTEGARADLERMRGDRTPTARPVVIIGGMFDFGIFVGDLAGELRGVLGPESEIVVINLFATLSMDDARERVIRAVDAALGGDDPLWTAEVDVVGFSLGGVVARHAAAPAGEGASEGRRLRIARLFTIASPHEGAQMASVPSLDERVWALRPGSEFLSALDAADEDGAYETFAYVRLGDRVVGERLAGVRDEPAYWVATPPLDLAHLFAYDDPRILADIARRLRGEAGHTTRPPAPLPERPYSSDHLPEPVLTAP